MKLQIFCFYIALILFSIYISQTIQQGVPGKFAVKVPSRTVSKAFYAQINSNTSVRAQFESQNYYVVYSWDFEKDCSSEYWYNRIGGIDNGFTSCNKLKTTYGSKKCVTVTDFSNNTSRLLSYYEGKFNETEGVVTDPFLDTENTYELWRSTDRKSWIWINETTKEIVFLQDFDKNSKKHYALYF